MEFTMTDSAVHLYIEEMDLSPGDQVRLFVRVGGVGSGGFSVGIMRDEPVTTSFQMNREGVTFFVNEDDFWFLDGMTIDYNDDMELLTFDNPSFDELDHPEWSKK